MYNKRKIRVRSFRTFTVAMLCLSCSLLQPSTLLFAAGASRQGPPTDQKRIYTLFKTRESAYRAEAATYDQAIRGFASVENMPMRTADDVKKVLAVLQRSSAGLKGVYAKTVVVALNTSAFRTGLEAEAGRTTAKTLHLQIQRTPAGLSSVRGLSDARTAIRRQLEADAAILKRVSTKLETAARQHGARLEISPSVPLSDDSHRALLARLKYSSFAPADLALASFASTPLKPSAEPAAFQGGPLEAALIAAAILIIGAFAERKLTDITEPADPTNERDTRSRYAVCMDDATAKRDHCLNNADFFKSLQCWAVYAADIARCNLLPL